MHQAFLILHTALGKKFSGILGLHGLFFDRKILFYQGKHFLFQILQPCRVYDLPALHPAIIACSQRMFHMQNFCPIRIHLLQGTLHQKDDTSAIGTFAILILGRKKSNVAIPRDDLSQFDQLVVKDSQDDCILILILPRLRQV